MKKAVYSWSIVLLACFCLQSPPLDACTTFCLDNGEQLVFGRNYDWGIGMGLVVVNKRDLAKKAFLSLPEKPAEWISKYGSITFNQYGVELPMGGINETGLVVEQMWLSVTKYPAPDDRPGVREVTWIQYLLDTCRTVDEAIVQGGKVRITRDSAPIHYLICDRKGNKAVIEFLDGKMEVRKGKDLPFAALANSTYKSSIDYARQFACFGGDNEQPVSTKSLDRFSKAAAGAKNIGEADEKADNNAIFETAFHLLEDVSQGKYTKWSIVYDLKNLAIRYKTLDSPEIKTLKLESFDFSGEKPSRLLDLNTPESGDVCKQFVDYSMEQNKKLIFDTWKKTEFLKDTPDELLNMIAAYPASITFIGGESEKSGRVKQG